MAEVSVIVPVYKSGEYLRRCIDSILAQTFRNFELLLIDDGSPDNSGAICDEYAEKDPRIKVFHKENGGVSSARNYGLDYAQGTYIMFCDSDDYVANTWIEELYGLISSPNVDFALCGYFIVAKSDNHIVSSCNILSEFCGKALPLSAFYSCIEMKIFNGPCNKIFKREVIIGNHLRYLQDVSCGEDKIFNLQYIQHCKNHLAISHSNLYFYMKGNSESLSTRYDPGYENSDKIYETELLRALSYCDIPFSAIKTHHFTDIITSIAFTTNKIISDACSLCFRSKRKECRKILSSKRCKEAFKNGEFVDFHPIYKQIFKTRCFILIWLFHSLVQSKHKLISKY